MPGVAGCVPGCPGEVRGYGTAGGGVVGAAWETGWEGDGVSSAWDGYGVDGSVGGSAPGGETMAEALVEARGTQPRSHEPSPPPAP